MAILNFLFVSNDFLVLYYFPKSNGTFSYLVNEAMINVMITAQV